MYPGLSGEGNIVISEKEEALTIPREYLIAGNKVITEDDTVTIVVGAENLERIEVLSGITENDMILKPIK